MRCQRSSVGSIACWSAFALLSATGAGSANADSLDELYEGALEVRQQLSSGFRIAFEFDKQTGTDSELVGSRRIVSVQSDQLRVDRYSLNGALYGWSHDGQASWTYSQRAGYATVQDGVEMDRRVDTNGSGFFDLMRWYPCWDLRGKTHEYDLLEVLSSPRAELREETETIDGHELYVVDLYDAMFGAELSRTLWIDPARGYLPIVQKHYRTNTPGGEPQEKMVYTITEAEEIGDGVWVPVEGMKEVTGVAGAASTYSLTVETTDAGAYDAALVETFEAGHFDYSTEVPPGTNIFDVDTDEAWIAKGDNLRATGEAAFASLPKEIRDKFADRSVQGQRAWWIPPYDEPAWLAVTVVAGVLTIAAMRKFGG